MPDYEKLTANLTRRGYTVRRFATARQAADYLDSVIDQTSVAFGGSVTLDQLDLYPRLSAHNRCLWHWKGDDRMDGMQTEVYLSSVNGLAETGELINIDGAGNRVASTLFGHKRVYFVVGANKIVRDLDEAARRVKEVAAPANCKRLGCATPCAVTGQCADCKGDGRICCTTVIHQKQRAKGRIKVILVAEPLGY